MLHHTHAGPGERSSGPGCTGRTASCTCRAGTRCARHWSDYGYGSRFDRWNRCRGRGYCYRRAGREANRDQQRTGRISHPGARAWTLQRDRGSSRVQCFPGQGFCGHCGPGWPRGCQSGGCRRGDFGERGRPADCGGRDGELSDQRHRHSEGSCLHWTQRPEFHAVDHAGSRRKQSDAAGRSAGGSEGQRQI